MKYYYFKKRNGVVMSIVSYDYEINTFLNTWLVPLNEKQLAFYRNNPKASPMEVWNCELIPPYVPPIEVLQNEAINHIDDEARKTISVFVDTLGFANAVATSLYAKSKGITPVYDDTEVLSTATNFLEKGKQCRSKYNECAELIKKTETKGEIDLLVSEAETFFQNLINDTDSLEKHRQLKLIDIDVYDNSDNVNGFYYNGMFMWLDKSTRVGLVNTLNSADELGRETVNIWYNNQVCVELDVESARMLLAAIELYATDCYNVTASHKKAVTEMESIEEIDAFDITAGYPPMLHFGEEENNQ